MPITLTTLRVLLAGSAIALVLAGCETGGEATHSASVGASTAPRAPTIETRRMDAIAMADGSSRAIEPPAVTPPGAGEQYAGITDNPVVQTAEQPVSTFGVDVDGGAYSNARRFLARGALPPKDAVRVEEFVNYFNYTYAAPPTTDPPFSILTDLAPCPWRDGALLLRVALKGHAPARAERPPANLVFLVDVSGSMTPPDRLPLAIAALKMLTTQMAPEDRLSVVTYAGIDRVVLDGAKGADREAILSALDGLRAGGGTAGAAGLRTAYQIARKHFVPGGSNRVLLATDGDFNVGITDPKALVEVVETERRSGVALSTLGFGAGNYAETRMEQLANKGNGNYAYIDGMTEARKVLQEEMAATLFTIASDVKIQIEFNPAQVAEYRLIGYENRALKREDFKNDAVDAGEIGAGHDVTALYEITPVGSSARRVDPLRYGPAPTAAGQPGAGAAGAEYAYVKLRWKAPGKTDSTEVSRAITTSSVHKSLAAAGPDFRLATAAAAFGQKLRRHPALAPFDYAAIGALLDGGAIADPQGLVAEFRQLIGNAAAVDRPAVSAR